jgi:hypothetical protein
MFYRPAVKRLTDGVAVKRFREDHRARLLPAGQILFAAKPQLIIRTDLPPSGHQYSADPFDEFPILNSDDRGPDRQAVVTL